MAGFCGPMGEARCIGCVEMIDRQWKCQEVVSQMPIAYRRQGGVREDKFRVRLCCRRWRCVLARGLWDVHDEHRPARGPARGL